MKTLAVAVASLFAGAAGAQTLPTGPTYTAGNTTASTVGAAMTVTQASQRAIIDWTTFNIGNGASVTFNQPAATSVAVNRVGLSGGSSSIAGTLTANGHVMLLNPNGVAFTSTAVVNVGGLIASTGNINDSQFMSGPTAPIAITGATAGAITNLGGTITVTGAGLAAFVAPSVSNSGTITATSGRIVLASAQAATISLTGGLYEIAVTQGVANGSINNSGTLTTGATGGSIVLSALDAANLVSGAINLTGVQQANTIEVDAGHVVLKSSLDAPTVTGNSNTIDVYSSAHVQDAIDIATTGSVGAGATINVYPGNYTETAMNRQIGAGVGGTYDLGLLVNKDNLTLRGVDANGNPITNANSVQAWITAGNSTDFGMNDGIVANNVTIQGMGFKPYAPGPNKTIEIAGDNLTFTNSVVDNRLAVGGAGALYFGELLTDHQIEKLTVTGSIFLDGSVSLQNGVGVAADGVTYQPAADRVISGNTFTGSSNYTFGGVLLTGEMDEIPWRPLPIGAATVTGNSFSGFTDSVLVRGAQQGVDLTQIMQDNSFDHAVLVTDAAGNARGETYLSTPDGVNFTPRLEYSIQSSIQAAINRAVNGDTVTVGAGDYAEQLTIAKSLSLVGAGANNTIIAPTSLAADTSGLLDILTIGGSPANNVEVSGFTIQGPVPNINYGVFVRDGAHAYIHDNSVLNIRFDPLSGVQQGVAIRVGSAALNTSGTAVIENNVITGYQKGGIVVDGPGTQATITGNTVTGAGPTGVTAQNGIQISRGASATVTGNTVSGNSYTGDDEATGILIFTPGANLGQGSIIIGPNTVTNNQVGLYTNDPRTLATISLAGISGNTTRNTEADFTGGFTGDGIFLAYPAWSASNAALVNATAFTGTQSGDIVNVGGVLRVSGWSGFTAIQPAINAVAAGGTVNVDAETYTQSTTLNVNKSITLAGAGEAQTIIDARTVSGYGMLVNADNVSLSDFTIYGPAANVSSSYGIKVQPAGTAASSRLNNFSITDVTSRGAGRAELDLNGVVGAVIDHVTANGAPVGNDAGSTAGAGIQVTDSANVAISNSTTLNNAWGGVALFQANTFFNQQTTNITVQANNSFTESIPLYMQDQSTSFNFGALTLLGFNYAVRNSGSADNSQFTWLQYMLPNAIDFAVNVPPPASSTVQGWSGTGTTQNFEVGVGNLLGGGTQAMSIAAAITNSNSGANIHVAAGTYAENVTVNDPRNLSFDAGSTIHSLTLNSGAGGSGIGGSLTADTAAGFMFNAPVVLLSDTVLATHGGNIALNGDIQNAGATSHALTLVAGSGATLGDTNMVTGGTQGNPLGEFDVTSNNFTLLSTLWVTGYKIDAASNVALSNHTLRAVDASASNVINAGGNVTGTTISSGNSQVTGSGDVSANVTAQGDVVVSGNNVSGNITGNNIVVGAQNSVNANVNATSTVVVSANGPANLSGSSPNLTVDAPSGNVSGSFSQINNVGSSIISLNGTPQAPATISASANSNQLIPSGTSIVDNTAAGGTSDGSSANSLLAASEGEDATGKSGGADHAAPIVRRSPARAGELFYKGRSVEIDLSPSNNR